MRLLGEDPLLGQPVAELPGRTGGAADDNPDHQTPPADFLHMGAAHGAQGVHQIGPLGAGVFDHPGVQKRGQGGIGHRAGQRVSAKGGAVVAGSEHIHDFGGREHGRDRVDPAPECFSEDDQIGVDALPVRGQDLAGAPKAGLDLIGHETDPVPRADVLCGLEEAIGWEHNAPFSLDGLDQKTDGVGGDGGLEGTRVAVRDLSESGGVRTKALSILWLGGKRDNADGPTGKVAMADNDLRLVGRDSLHLIAPLSDQLDGRLDRLSPGVHEDRLVIAEGLAEALDKGPHPVIIEGARRERDSAELRMHRFDHKGVTMPMAQGRVAGEHIQVPAPLDILHPAPLPVRQNDGERLVVTRRPAGLEVHEALLFGERGSLGGRCRRHGEKLHVAGQRYGSEMQVRGPFGSGPPGAGVRPRSNGRGPGGCNAQPRQTRGADGPDGRGPDRL